MDAAEADADVKLYKASGELLAELQAKIPLLLQDLNGKPRKWVFYSRTGQLVRLLDTFQEWPQLLDPILSRTVQQLVDAFLTYCLQHRNAYSQSTPDFAKVGEPLPRAICRLLYVFCKVRGQKIIVRLLNNEPKYLDPLLESFNEWNQTVGAERSGMSWEERYIMLLWLSHLMLAPFELSSISAPEDKGLEIPEMFTKRKLPTIAKLVLKVALDHLYAPSKEREAASILIVRLALRGDMQRLSLPNTIIDWCTGQLSADRNHAISDQYRHVGLLTLLYGITNSASSKEAAIFIEDAFDTCILLATDDSPGAIAARQAAPSRKLLIKSIRASLLHMIALSSTGDEGFSDLLDTSLEQAIQVLLEWLSDSDTPVRQASSKAMGATILQLPVDMAVDVVDAVLACLDENILLENRQTGQLVMATDLINLDMSKYKKNLNAVDSLKWHGAMLTLGYVLFRRSAPPQQLSAILNALILGLNFEQRSNVGTSLGVSVRDAACFGLWSLARKYTTTEIEAAELSTSAVLAHALQATEIPTTLQIVATELVLSSCLDPSGNLRRGSSAALQELIGRHPDVITSGIPVVQQVDYHAVARRSRAMLEVSPAVSYLGAIYHISLLYGLLDWRGCRAVDVDSRRQAAATVGILFSKANASVQISFSQELASQIQDLRPGNMGVNAAARHGLLSILAEILTLLPSLPDCTDGVLDNLGPLLKQLETVTGSLAGKVTTDLCNVLEASARCLAAEAKLIAQVDSDLEPHFLSSAQTVLNRCTTANEDNLLTVAAADANEAVFMLLNDEQRQSLLESWLPTVLPKSRSDFTCKGRIKSLGKIFSRLRSTGDSLAFDQRVVHFLSSIVTSDLGIESRVNAMEGISEIVGTVDNSDVRSQSALVEAISYGLLDYTNDQRGDIGSLLRIASIDAVNSILESNWSVNVDILVGSIVRLAAERLGRIRFLAWTCLHTWRHKLRISIDLNDSYQHLADFSSFEYFRQITELLLVPALRKHVLAGLVTSIVGGGDDVGGFASAALVALLEECPTSERLQQLQRMISLILHELERLAKRDDREVLPWLVTLCVIFEQFLEDVEKCLNVNTQEIDIWSVVNALQSSGADIARIETLIRLVLSLSQMENFTVKALDFITRKLLHKWPRVRQASVEAVYMFDEEAMPVATDWSLNPAENKPTVVAVRKMVGVAGKAA